MDSYRQNGTKCLEESVDRHVVIKLLGKEEEPKILMMALFLKKSYFILSLLSF